MLPYLDCSDETSEIRETSGKHRGWLANEIKSDDWVMEVTAEVIGEIDRLAEFLQQNPLPMLQSQSGHSSYDGRHFL